MEAVSHHEAYIRCSWAFRFVCLALPLIIHLQATSPLDYVHGKASSVAMEPDIASAIFVISASLAISRVLAKAIPFYTDEQQRGEEEDAERRRKPTLKVETMMICLIMVLGNIVCCDFALRLVWIPVQYLLWWICKHKLLTLVVKTVLFFVKDFTAFRPYYLKALANSSSRRGFQFLRLVTALKILHSVVARLEEYPKQIALRDRSYPPAPSVVAEPEGTEEANVSEKVTSKPPPTS
ncbi:uncharacterized protein LOC120905228 [Anopheles arabiensis]|uniref:Uncharacterized protein n=1 Tax=Anopheles arabiensis TaxID=7173 RepID=A0A2C9GRY0_ANOAR|nr:uncharacterized protein LOC120905228 [Anopheles arabiensis]